MTNNSDELNIISIPELFRNKIYKKIVFATEGLTIEKTASFDPAIFIPADEISSFRFGVNWIRGYKFTFGRQYIIQIQDQDKKIFTIKLGSYYQIRRKVYLQIWSDIINGLWSNYFINTFNYYFDLYKTEKEFDLAGIKFHLFGIRWDDQRLFWKEIGLSNYKTYFMIHHRDDLKITKSISFKNDWNALILQCLLKKITEEHNSNKQSEPE